MTAPSDADAIAENAHGLERLRRLVARIDDAAMGRDLGGGWTVGAALAHLAFWDRISEQRWRSWVTSGDLVDFQGGTDFVNDAGIHQWRALAPSAVRKLVIDAATAVDGLIADGGATRVAAVVAAGKPRWAHRHLHRGEHIQQIETAIGR